MPAFLDQSSMKTMINNLTLEKGKLYQKFKTAYDNDIGMKKYEESSAEMRIFCETESRVIRLFNQM